MIATKLDEQKTVTIKEVEFVIGFIPRRIWKKIATRLGSCLLNAKGETPEKALLALPKEDFISANNELNDVYFDLVKYSVKSHRGINDKDGKEIPLDLKDGVISDAMLDLYDLNGFVVPLAGEIMQFNSMTEDDKKKL